MTRTLVVLMDSSTRQRSVRWVLQALLLVSALGQPAIWFLISAVFPLALDAPLRPLSSGRGLLAARSARVLGVAAVVAGPSPLAIGYAPLLRAALQTGLVFAIAFGVSRYAVPLMVKVLRTGRA
jgi:hypothetical protein